MENKKLKNPILNELEEDALSNVSGGNSEDIYATCPYCCGRLYLTINNVPVPKGEIKCSFCGYRDGDPSTIPNMEELIG